MVKVTEHINALLWLISAHVSLQLLSKLIVERTDDTGAVRLRRIRRGAFTSFAQIHSERKQDIKHDMHHSKPMQNLTPDKNYKLTDRVDKNFKIEFIGICVHS